MKVKEFPKNTEEFKRKVVQESLVSHDTVKMVAKNTVFIPRCYLAGEVK